VVSAAIAALASAHATKYELAAGASVRFRSYHVHVQFRDDRHMGNRSVAASEALLARFKADFASTLGAPCTGLFDQGRLCMFDTYMAADGPFVGPQWAVFVPLELHAAVVPWFMRHRSDDLVTVFVHPNSGAAYCDHVKWALWGGTPWPLIAEIFLAKGDETPPNCYAL